MEEKIIYIAVDGVEFSSCEECVRHEVAINFATKYQQWDIPNLCSCSGESVTASVLVKWVLENKQEVLRLYGVNYG